MHVNYIVYAIGLKGDVVDKVFVPYRETDGCFPIFSEELQSVNGSLMQKAENKLTGIRDIGDAVRLIRAGGHRWRLKEHSTGQVNIYKPEHIVIHEV